MTTLSWQRSVSRHLCRRKVADEAREATHYVNIKMPSFVYVLNNELLI